MSPTSQLKSLEGRIVREGRIVQEQILFDEDSGLIVDVGALKIPREEITYFFGPECLVFSGMGDVHVHAREDVTGKHLYKEDFASASLAALGGGVMHFSDMPNNPCPPVDDESYRHKFALTNRVPVAICLYAGVGRKTRPLNLLVPYKVYMGPSIGDLFFPDEQALDEVLHHYRGQNVSFHCEDPLILEEKKGEKDHESRRPKEAEIFATKTALHFIEKFSLQGKLCHYSAKEGLTLIREAKKQGLAVECEVTPQHLYFFQEELEKLPPEKKILFQMNPPLRGREDADALLDGIRDGTIDYLATDHAPHSPEEKQRGTSGLTGLDTYGPFVTWLLREKGIDPLRVNQICCENPGRFFNRFLPTLRHLSPSYDRWGKGLGFIEKGFSASFTVLNLESPYLVTRESLKTKALSSPFEGVTFPGRVEKMFLQGKVPMM